MTLISLIRVNLLEHLMCCSLDLHTASRLVWSGKRALKLGPNKLYFPILSYGQCPIGTSPVNKNKTWTPYQDVMSGIDISGVSQGTEKSGVQMKEGQGDIYAECTIIVLDE